MPECSDIRRRRYECGRGRVSTRSSAECAVSTTCTTRPHAPGSRSAACRPQSLARTRPAGGWPGAVPVQIHVMDADSFFCGAAEIDTARALVAAAKLVTARAIELLAGLQ